MKTMKIRIKDKHVLDYLKDKMFTTKHFENILLILLNQDFKENNSENFKLLTNGSVMRAVIAETKGGKKASDVELIKTKYKDNKLMQNLIATGKELKTHNLVEQIKDIKKNYDGFFTKHKKGDKEAKPPKPKKLSKIHNLTIFMDGYKSYTFKRKNQIGINVNDKMIYTHVKHESILKVVKNFNNVRCVNLNYSNGYVYLLIVYDEPEITEVNKPKKIAGIDIGVNNLLSIFVDDETTPSLRNINTIMLNSIE